MKRYYFLAINLLIVTSIFSQKKSTLFERKENFIDIRDQLELYSMILTKYSTPSLWLTTMDSPEFDEAILLPDTNLLFGAIDLKPISSHQISLHNKYALYPEYHSLYKIDSKTGAILWEYGRTGKFWTSRYQIIDISDKLITLYHKEKSKAQFIGIDLDKGTGIWNLPIPIDARYLVLKGSSTLFVYSTSKKETTYKGYSLSNHQLLYAKTLPEVSDTCTIKQLGGGGILILDGKRSFLLDAVSGEVKKTMVHKAKYSDAIAFDHSYMVNLNSGESQLFTNEGANIWQKNYNYSPFLASEVGDFLYWIKYIGGTSLVALNARNGEEKWQLPLDGSVKSNLCFYQGKIAVTTSQSLYFIDSKQGTLERKFNLTSPQLRAPDRIEGVKGAWVVMSENGVACYHPDSLKACWSYDLADLYQSISDCSSEVDYFKMVNNIKVNHNYTNYTFGVNHSDYYMLTAQRNVDYWKHESSINPSAYTRSMSGLASQNYIATATVSKAFDQMMSNINILQSGQKLGMAIYEDKVKELDLAGLKRAQAKYTLAAKENMLMLQGGYYIKRIETEKSVSLFVVKIEDGSWAEIVLSPGEGKYIDESALIKTCFFVYNPSLKTISCNGLGLNPDKWQPVEIHQTTTVKRSILSYSIAKMKFMNKLEYPAKSVTMKK